MSAERLRLLGDFENSYVRREPWDKEGWLRTIVAFANSCPLEDEAVLFIGATDDGLVQVKPGEDLDKLQRTLSERVLAQVYPRVRVMHPTEDGRSDLFGSGCSGKSQPAALRGAILCPRWGDQRACVG